jgi:hypothetical protein
MAIVWQQLIAEPHGRHGQKQRELRIAVGEIEAPEGERSAAASAASTAST